MLLLFAQPMENKGNAGPNQFRSSAHKQHNSDFDNRVGTKRVHPYRRAPSPFVLENGASRMPARDWPSSLLFVSISFVIGSLHH
jgi:hypothetical protein